MSIYVSTHPHRIKINLHVIKTLQCTINIQLRGLIVKILKIFHRILFMLKNPFNEIGSLAN